MRTQCRFCKCITADKPAIIKTTPVPFYCCKNSCISERLLLWKSICTLFIGKCGTRWKITEVTHPLIHSRRLWSEVWEVQCCVRKRNHAWKMTGSLIVRWKVLGLGHFLTWPMNVKGIQMLTGVGEYGLGMARQQQQEDQVEHWPMENAPHTVDGSEEDKQACLEQ